MIKTRLLKLLPHGKKQIAAIVFFQWAALLAQAAVVYAAAGILSGILSGKHMEGELWKTAAVFAAAVCIRFFCDKNAARLSWQTSAGAKRILRQRIYDKLVRLGISYKERVSTAEVVQLCMEGTEQMEVYFGKYLPQLFYSLLAPVTLFALLAPVSLKAAAILLICVPLIPLSIVAVQKIAKRLLNRYWSIYTGLGDSFLENLQGLTTLKIYQADEKKAAEMDEEAAKFRRITMKVLTMQLNSTSVMDIIAYGGAAAGMLAASMEYRAGAIDARQTLILLLLASEFFIPLRVLGSFFHIAMNGMAASDKMFALLDLEETKKGTERAFRKAEDICIRKLDFSYTKDREILKDVTITIPAGNLVSLVGESGCGKSTIAGILSGKNRSYRGSAAIGGKEITDIAEPELMNYITCVQHNSYLFCGTVEENLRMAKADASRNEMDEVLKKVNLYDFLYQQQGLKTKLSERGDNLSGGQRQRLALARALLHDTPVYIFDEAASNIDAESEALIMQVILELAETKSVLFISHRLSNVTASDCIYFIQDGRVTECGTHGELLEKDGAYRTLFLKQTLMENYGKV